MSDRDQNNTFRAQSVQGREPDNTGNLQHGYGDGGATPFGQLTQGASNQAEGGFGGDSVGGYGQQNLNAQGGQGGRSPMIQGAGYGQGGSQFGPAGRDSQSGRTPYSADPDHRSDYRNSGRPFSRHAGEPGGGYFVEGGGSYAQQDFSPAAQRSRLHEDQRHTGPGADFHAPPPRGGPRHHDDHEPHYRQWRDAQLDSHDRDYAHWRDEQARRYDEEYRGWRGERHATFTKEFEGWRANRGGQSTGSASEASTPPNVNAAHGANPTLADIADGGHERQDGEHKDDKAS
jgi:hypothetical protein